MSPPDGVPPEQNPEQQWADFDDWDRPREPWLLTGDCPDPTKRTLLLETTARIVFPTVLVFSLYLLLAGHYQPGGGFSGGLVAGLAFVLRYIAGGRQDAGAAVLRRPPMLIGAGLMIAVLTALTPALFGAPALSTAIVEVDVPVLGHLELVTSLFLDLGVYLLIVGVVLDLLRSLGSGIERDANAAGERS
ncbi:MAG: MnhB domain-containing protein [Pseudonocardiaceae bacterium]